VSRTEFLDGRVALHAGDCMDVLKTLADNSVDSCVTDPPYHLVQMTKRYSAGDAKPCGAGKDGSFRRLTSGFMGKKWDGGDIAFRPELWAEVLRVLKPGAYILAFASTRGFGRMSVAIEDAGFITHPLIAWMFATGFPKAARVKAEGYDGWRYGGQALKPAIEPIYMGQKPFSEDTGTANILRWGTGAINVDGCRIDMAGEVVTTGQGTSDAIYGGGKGLRPAEMGTQQFKSHTLGRWPANLCHDGSDEVVAAFPETASHGGGTSNTGFWARDDRGQPVPSGDSGSAARFFYSAKADANDRIGSKHPTVKPVDLMQWLCRLVTPPGGIVLDCFAGTGVTGEAAWHEGFSAILIEREEEYCNDIARRMKLVKEGQMTRRTQSAKARGKPVDHGPLFDIREAAE